MNLKHIQKLVGQIRSDLFKRSNSYAVGMLRSHFKGMGLQFKEHQVYTHGDDVRMIDWKMLAKTTQPYIKIYEEERNVEIIINVDASKSMFSGFKGVSKLQAAMEICCLFYLLTEKTGDLVEVNFFADTHFHIKKSNGHQGISRFISTLSKKGLLDQQGRVNLAFSHKKKLDDKEIYASLMNNLKKKKQIIMLSDFNEFLNESILKKILYKSNLHSFQILSPLDLAQKNSFLFFCSDQFNLHEGSLKKANFKAPQEFSKEFGKKFKKLRLDERYLENLVRNML
jgi:uncharacterized protein (DUF58 family)